MLMYCMVAVGGDRSLSQGRVKDTEHKINMQF